MSPRDVAGSHLTPGSSDAAPPTRAGSPLSVWLAIVVLAMPVSWLLATLGVTIALADPARDIAIILLWSASEEIVFRGGVQTLLRRALARSVLSGGNERPRWFAISAANLLTSLLFCAAHLLHKPLWVVFGLFPVSVLLGASLERSGRLWVPVALHAYFNLLLYAASAWIPG